MRSLAEIACGPQWASAFSRIHVGASFGDRQGRYGWVMRGAGARPPRQFCGGADYTLRAQQPLELLGVQPMPAHHGAVEEQDRDIQAIAADKLRISVDVHDNDGG